MILVSLANAERYAPLHRGFAAAFEFLRSTDLTKLMVGRHELDGQRLVAIVGRELGKGQEAAKLEAHRRYIDIQYCFEGHDLIGWQTLDACHHVVEPYAAERDIEFFAERPECWLTLAPGRVAIFFPDDAHAPLAGDRPLAKVVVKVAV